MGFALMASASSHDHIPVFFQDDVGVIVKVKNRDGIELSRCTAWLGHVLGIHKVNQGLYNGVVGGIHVCVEWEGTLSITVVGSIAFGCNDPVLPSQVLEAHVKLMLFAGCF